MVSNSTIRYNGSAVVQGGYFGLSGTVDLGGGAVGGRNTVACSNSVIENGYPYPGDFQS